MSSPGEHELTVLRDRIATFEGVKCGMKHEGVEREQDSIQPLYNEAVDHGFQRCEYCPNPIRRTRVACAHTNARNELRDAIGILQQRIGEQQQTTEQTDDLRTLDERVVLLDASIFTLDLGRSEEELVNAQKADEVCQGRQAGSDFSGPQDELRQSDQLISELEAQHDEYVDQAAILRDDVLEQLNRVLERE